MVFTKVIFEYELQDDGDPIENCLDFVSNDWICVVVISSVECFKMLDMILYNY